MYYPPEDPNHRISLMLTESEFNILDAALHIFQDLKAGDFDTALGNVGWLINVNKAAIEQGSLDIVNAEIRLSNNFKQLTRIVKCPCHGKVKTSHLELTPEFETVEEFKRITGWD